MVHEPGVYAAEWWGRSGEDGALSSSPTLRVVSYNVGLRGLRTLALREPQTALRTAAHGTCPVSVSGGGGDAHGVVRLAGYGGLKHFLRALVRGGDRDVDDGRVHTGREICGNARERVIICIQEVKQSKSQLSMDVCVADGFDSFFDCGKHGYAGVATFVSENAATNARAVSGALGLWKLACLDYEDLHDDMICDTVIANDEDGEAGCSSGVMGNKASRVAAALAELDREGRCITVDVGDVVIVNVYAPAAGATGERSTFKACYISAILHAARVLEERLKRLVIVCGDLNVAYGHIDVPQDMLAQVCGADDDEHERCLAWRSVGPSHRVMNRAIHEHQTVVDCFRLLHPRAIEQYSCWNVAAGMQLSNYGTRIDHILAVGGPAKCSGVSMGNFVAKDGEDGALRSFSHRFADMVHVDACDYLRHVEGSDHCPMYCVFRLLTSDVHPMEEQCERIAPLAAQFQIESSRNLFTRNQASMKTFLVDRRTLAAAEASDNLLVAKRRASDGDESMDACRRPTTDATKLSPSATTSKTNGVKKQKKRDGGGKARSGNGKQASLKAFFSTHTDDKSTGRDTAQEEEEKQKKQVDEGCTAAALATVSGAGLDFVSHDVSERENASSVALHANVQQNAERQQEQSVAKMAWQALQHKMVSSIPRCKKHGEVCKLRVVRRKDSPHVGRSFYCCPRPAGAKDDPETDCGFFKWASSSSRPQKTTTTMFT